jgi:Citrate transporter
MCGWPSEDKTRPRPHRPPLAIGAICGVILLAGFDVLPIAALALIAAVLVIGTKCLDLEKAYEAIGWSLLFHRMWQLCEARQTTLISGDSLGRES